VGYSLLLGQTPVARLVSKSHHRLGLRFEEQYKLLPDRPVVSLSFEDDLRRDYWGRSAQKLPNFLDNLLPEGQLSKLLRQQFDVHDEDDASLLALVGEDLPGAVYFREDSGATLALEEAAEIAGENGSRSDLSKGQLRFSLAGVQLKFSMLRQDRKLALPARGEEGDWIVKLSFGDFPGLPENEHAMMTWAKRVGFSVPETEIWEKKDISGLDQWVNRDFRALAVRRYDRTDTGRIHQEDFAQVLGRPPGAKYDGKAEEMLIVVSQILGFEAFEQFMLRLAFTVAIGNFDAHLKNWSLFYPDPRIPRLAPLYDQVSTIAWPQLDRELSFKFLGAKHPGKLVLDSWGRLASRLGCCDAASVEIRRKVASLLESMRESWPEIRALLPREHSEEIVRHWGRLQMLREVGSL